MTDCAPWPERHRDHLRRLGMTQLDQDLIDKVDLSGVIQFTMLEAFQQKDEAPQNADEQVIWLRRVFMNNLLDALRKLRTQKRDIGREQSLEESIGRSTSRLEACLSSDESTPSVKAARNEQTERLLRFLAMLPPAQRQAIQLHHIEGLPLDEASLRMGKPKGAIAALIYRGMKTLRSNAAF